MVDALALADQFFKTAMGGSKIRCLLRDGNIGYLNECGLDGFGDEWYFDFKIEALNATRRLSAEQLEAVSGPGMVCLAEKTDKVQSA